MSGKQEYVEWVEANPSATPIFYHPFFLDIIAPGWYAAMVINKAGDVNGVWPYVSFKKLGMNIGFNPLFVPHLGPHIVYPPNQQKQERKLRYEKKVLSELVDQLPNHSFIKIKVNPALTNWLPLHWKGYSETLYYTYQLELGDEEHLVKNYTNDIRKALQTIPDGISITHDYKMTDVLSLMQSSFEKQSYALPLSEGRLIELDKALRSRQLTHCEVAHRDDGTPIGCVYTFYSNDLAYMPIIGRGNLRPEEKGIIKLLMHRCILAASKRVKVFDFEGSMISQFEKVFRSFGSHQVGYHVISKATNPLVKYYYLFR